MSNSLELTVGCFLLLLGVELGPTMFAVTSGYSVSEKVLFMWERRLLADREFDVNCLNTNCLLTSELQQHSESIAMMSIHSNMIERFDGHSFLYQIIP